MDDQEIPKKLVMLSKLRDEAKKPNQLKSKVPKNKLLDSTKHMGYEMRLPGMKKDLRSIPVFQQQEGEKQRQFFRRMNQQVAVSFIQHIFELILFYILFEFLFSNFCTKNNTRQNLTSMWFKMIRVVKRNSLNVKKMN